MSENPLTTRLRELMQQDESIRLYALVDGLQWEEAHGERLERQGDRQALFHGTPDAPLAHAGPWLVDTHLAPPEMLEKLVALETARPAVVWVYSTHELDGLTVILQSRLDALLPDGRRVLLRFYDPRVLLTLHKTLTTPQRMELLSYTHEWHLLDENGQRVRIEGYPGGVHADAHA